MEELEIRKKTVYSYSETFLKQYQADIKRKIISQCKNDKTLSSDFIKTVLNEENIHVELKPHYVYDLCLEIHPLYVKYSFDYTFTYSSVTGLSGDIKYNSSSNSFDTSNVSVQKEYSSSTETHRGRTAWYSTKFKKCHVHLGGDIFNENNLQNYNRVSANTKMEMPLASLVKKDFTYDDVNKEFTVSKLPQFVYDEIKSDAIDMYKSRNPRNFKMSIDDYIVQDATTTIFPNYCEFSFWISYNGKRYGQNCLKSIDEICSCGPKSDHYTKFKEELGILKDKYDTDKWKSHRIYIFMMILCGISAISLLLLLIFSKLLGHEGIQNIYLWSFIGIIVGFVVLFLIARGKKSSYYLVYSDNMYNPILTITEHKQRIEAKFKKEKKSAVRKSKLWLLLTITAMVGTLFYANNAWNTTNIEYFWYTPEVVQTYYKPDNGVYGYYDVIKITNCDTNGKVYITITDKDGWYKKSYEGKIVKKNNIITRIEVGYGQGFSCKGYEFTIEFLKGDYSKCYYNGKDRVYYASSL